MHKMWLVWGSKLTLFVRVECQTDMGGADAPQTIEEGADTAVWLALLGEDGPNGGYFRERQLIAW
ncbi:hypothetical protein ABES58_21185 [Paenibacillus lautus]|uniref:hypothetical protein n=1 Tax=Paenibacillus lautus TaxID=1401 RepID=UPI003D290E45